MATTPPVACIEILSLDGTSVLIDLTQAFAELDKKLATRKRQ